MKEETIISIRGIYILAALALLYAGSFFIKPSNGKAESETDKITVVKTYDEEGLLVDYIKGKSIDIAYSKESPPVVVFGDNTIKYPNVPILLYEEGLVDVLSLDPKLMVSDTHSPVLNKLVRATRGWAAKNDQLILISTQSNTPIAAFYGDTVSHSTIEGGYTEFLIDNKRLIFSKVQYTVYDMNILRETGIADPVKPKKESWLHDMLDIEENRGFMFNTEINE